MQSHSSFRTRSRRAAISFGAVLAAGSLALVASSSASAATSLAGPIDLGDAASFGVLSGSSLTNTGVTVVDGDIGTSPGASITGFDGSASGTQTGTRHQNDAVAAEAQADLTEAINDAASLTPAESNLADLSGRNLSPGVYSGGALLLPENGVLTLTGDAQSVWVFQAASTLTIETNATVALVGGASACNVFWQVGSSATLLADADFQGTILSQFDISVEADTTVAGRLLAKRDVTLIEDLITVPTGCAPGVSPVYTEAPTVTSGEPTSATVGLPYSFGVTSSAAPAPAYTVTSGSLPAGLQLDSTTGVIAGTPTAPGTSTFTITVSNGVGPDASVTYTIVSSAPVVAAAPELASTGPDALLPGAAGALILALGAALVVGSRRRRSVVG